MGPNSENEPESKPTVSSTESGNGSSENRNALRTQPATISNKDDQFSHEKMSRSSSSSSSSSSSGDPFDQLGPIDDETTQLTSQKNENGLHVSSLSGHAERNANHTQTLTSSENGFPNQLLPPTQVMEKLADHSTSSPSPSYRIPSSVFDREKSNCPMEWSVASNESLFSIPVGNLSFTRDNLSWLGKSGELGLTGEFSMYGLGPGRPSDFSGAQLPSNQLPGGQHPSVQSPISVKSTEIQQKTDNSVAQFGVNESKTPEAMINQGVKEKKKDEFTKPKSPVKGPLSSASLRRASNASQASVKSFAFPILEGDDRKQHPLPWLQSRPQSPKATQQQEGSQPHSPQKSQPRPQPQTPKPEGTIPKAAAANAARGKWFSCFPCCFFCP